MTKKGSKLKKESHLSLRTAYDNDDMPVGNFYALPLSKQRAILTRALQSKQTRFVFGDTVYELPLFVQITYRCTKCGASKGMRQYTQDFLNCQTSQKLQCHNCRRFQLERILTSAPLDYSLEKLHKAKGLYKYLIKKRQDFIQDDV